MTQYKSIREWIAEDVDPIGYVDKDRLTVIKIEMDAVASRCTLVSATCGMIPQRRVSLDHPVAPPAPKRLSDEELLQEYDETLVYPTFHKPPNLRSQILDRMKAKGPTRGEVDIALVSLLVAHTRLIEDLISTDQYSEKRSAFLSMFPEGDQ